MYTHTYRVTHIHTYVESCAHIVRRIHTHDYRHTHTHTQSHEYKRHRHTLLNQAFVENVHHTEPTSSFGSMVWKNVLFVSGDFERDGDTETCSDGPRRRAVPLRFCGSKRESDCRGNKWLTVVIKIMEIEYSLAPNAMKVTQMSSQWFRI